MQNRPLNEEKSDYQLLPDHDLESGNIAQENKRIAKIPAEQDLEELREAIKVLKEIAAQRKKNVMKYGIVSTFAWLAGTIYFGMKSTAEGNENLRQFNNYNQECKDFPAMWVGDEDPKYPYALCRYNPGISDETCRNLALNTCSASTDSMGWTIAFSMIGTCIISPFIGYQFVKRINLNSIRHMNRSEIVFRAQENWDLNQYQYCHELLGAFEEKILPIAQRMISGATGLNNDLSKIAFNYLDDDDKNNFITPKGCWARFFNRIVRFDSKIECLEKCGL